MKWTSVIIVLLLAAVMTSSDAKKKKKGKSNKRPPQWKPNSMTLVDQKRYQFSDEGQTVSLNCRAKGKPRPKVTWYHNGQMLTKDDFTQMKKSGDLIMLDVSPERSGNYTCIVQNSLGNLEYTYRVQIESKIMELDLEGPSNHTATAGSRMQFMCRVKNDATAGIKWYRGQGEPQSFIDPGMDQEILVLDNLKKEDEGFYGCQAANLWSKISKEAYLTVIEPRVPPKTTDDHTIVPWYNTGDFGMYSTPKRPTDDGNMFLTTRKPRNRNGGKKNRKNKKKDKKNRKNKGQRPDNSFGNSKDDFDNTDNMGNFGNTDNMNPIDDPDTFDRFDNPEDFNNRYGIDGTDDMYVVSTRKPAMKPSPTPRQAMTEKNTTAVVWEYDKDKMNNHGHDGRGRNTDDRLKEESKGPASGSQDKPSSSSISSWTIYTIVGAVGGVVLLIGLTAITMTLCCNKEDTGVYKSTSV